MVKPLFELMDKTPKGSVMLCSAHWKYLAGALGFRVKQLSMRQTQQKLYKLYNEAIKKTRASKGMSLKSYKRLHYSEFRRTDREGVPGGDLGAYRFMARETYQIPAFITLQNPESSAIFKAMGAACRITRATVDEFKKNGNIGLNGIFAYLVNSARRSRTSSTSTSGISD